MEKPPRDRGDQRGSKGQRQQKPFVFIPSLGPCSLFIRPGRPLQSGKERMESVLEQWPSEAQCPSPVMLGGELSGMGLFCSE